MRARAPERDLANSTPSFTLQHSASAQLSSAANGRPGDSAWKRVRASIRQTLRLYKLDRLLGSRQKTHQRGNGWHGAEDELLGCFCKEKGAACRQGIFTPEDGPATAGTRGRRGPRTRRPHTHPTEPTTSIPRRASEVLILLLQ